MYKLSCNNLNSIEWENANTCLFAVKNVAVWKLQLSHFISSIDYLFALLHQEEKNKASLFKLEKDKNAYIIRWGILRILLAKCLQQDPVSINFIKGKNNKPALEKNKNTPDLFFNISYADDCALIAIADHEIGIDVERIEPSFNHKEILAVLFSGHEIEIVQSAADPSRMFYTFFTRKESILKAMATGISNSMINIPVSDGDHFITENNESGITDHLKIYSFLFDNAYAASLTCNNTVSNIDFYLADKSLLAF